jgi:hypothetical protein
MAEPAKDENGLPERIGKFLGAVIFVGTCILIIWPLARHTF